MKRINIKTASLEEIEDHIIELLDTTFGHNIIGIILSQVKERFGKEKADEFYELYQND